MKQFKLAFVLTMLMSMVGLQAFANWTVSSINIDGLQYNLDYGEHLARVTKTTGKKYSGDISIPDKVFERGDPYIVTIIGESAFHSCTDLTSVTIGNNVESIGNNAFANCSRLNSVIIPISVTSIGEYAFYRCAGLTSIDIQQGVKSIGDWAFDGCTGLTSVAIGGLVRSVGNFAFANCTGLTSIFIVGSVTSIGESAFEGCSGLTSMRVIKNTKYDSRNNCNAIIETSSNTLIAGCKNTIIPNDVTSIGNYAFYGCSGLTSISIPSSVKSIGKGAFYGCSNLTSVTVLNPTPVAITEYVFTNRTNATLYVPKGSLSAYKSADYWKEFYIVELPNIVFADANVKALCVANWDTNHDGELSTGEAASVTDLGRTFQNNKMIKSFDELQYFTGLTNISESAFEGCSELTSIAIPSGVTSIDGSAFSGCSGLTSVIIPNSVTSIGNSAFSWCSGLTSVTIPESVTSIGFRAFDGCYGLTSVTIPYSVTSIGNYAFYGCYGLTSVTVDINTPLTITENTFSNRANSVLIVLAGSKSAYEVADYWKEFKEIVETKNLIVFADANVKALCVANWDTNDDGKLSMEEAASVTDLGETFRGNTMIKSFDELQYFTGLTNISERAFEGCSELTSITIPNSVTSIGFSAFFGCSGLTSITIPNSVTSIGMYAFRDCSLTSVTIPNSVTRIGYWAFVGCSGSVTLNSNAIVSKDYSDGDGIIEIFGGPVAEYIIGDNVTRIGEGAFRYYSKLTSVTIGNSVTSIDGSAFSGCSGLISVTVLNPTPVEIDYDTFTNRANATLYVPQGSKSAYQAADYWKEFKEIVEIVPSGIDQIMSNGQNKFTIFTLDGKRISEFQKGLNIVKKANGQTVKVLVK